LIGDMFAVTEQSFEGEARVEKILNVELFLKRAVYSVVSVKIYLLINFPSP